MPDLIDLPQPTWTDEARQDLLLAIADCNMFPTDEYDTATGDRLYVCDNHDDDEPTTDDAYCPTGHALANAALKALEKHRSPGERRLAGSILWWLPTQNHDDSCAMRTGMHDCTCWKSRLRAMLPAGDDDAATTGDRP